MLKREVQLAVESSLRKLKTTSMWMERIYEVVLDVKPAVWQQWEFRTFSNSLLLPCPSPSSHLHYFPLFSQLTDSVLHHRNKGLKTLLSVGGWNFGTSRWVCAIRSSLWDEVEVMGQGSRLALHSLSHDCWGKGLKWLFAFQICRKKARMRALVTYCISPRCSWEMIS